MKLASSAILLTVFIVGVSSAKWSFGADEWLPGNTETVKISMLTRRSAEANENEAKKEQSEQERIEERNYEVKEPIYSNETDVNDVIEHILTSRREGRSLGEYDEIYADGNVEQALQQGDDQQARNLVKDKLCALGLLSCDVQEKRPFYSTIHAQRPPPPNFGGGPYGPPRPMLTPTHNRYGSPPTTTNNRYGQPPVNSFGPPRKVGFEGPPVSTPFYGRPGSSSFLGSSPSLISDSSVTFDKPPPGAVIYGSKPPGPIYSGNSDAPYSFEHVVKEQIQVAGSQQNRLYSQQQQSNQIQSAAATAAAGLQQHVHHHFHHVEGEGAAIKAPSVPIPIGGGNTINTDFTALAQSSTGFAPITSGGFSQSSAFNAGFNGASQGGLLSTAINQKPNGGVYKPTSGFGGYTEDNGLSTGGNYGQLTYGQSSNSNNGLSNSYHTSNPDYYKKELQGSAGLSAQYNGYGSSIGSSQYQGGYDTSRQQIIDCTCVPFNQCPAADRIGRKDDLILPIDPRNLGKDIEAISDEEAAANDTLSDHSKNESESTDSTKKTKRATTIEAEDEQQPAGANDEDVNNFEGRQRLPHLSLSRRKILPTFGVSFGLPYPTGAYPVNSINGYPNPAQNPHFGAISPNGLNLGLVNVNPLVSVQVSKTEYGEKVVKPLVNLHVTPNENIIQKVSEIFRQRQRPAYNQHYHHHNHYDHGYQHTSGPDPLYHHHHQHNAGSHFEMIPSDQIFEYHSGHSSSSQNFPITSPESVYPDYQPDYDSNIYGYDRSSNANASSIIAFDDDSSNHFHPNDGDGNRGGRISNFDSNQNRHSVTTQAPGNAQGSDYVTFPKNRRRKRSAKIVDEEIKATNGSGERSVVMVVVGEKRAYYGNRPPVQQTCRPHEVCCRRPLRPIAQQQLGKCGTRNANGITGRIKNPAYIDGDSEFGEYPWHVAILKKDPKESIYACGGTLIDGLHVITAAHCIKAQNGFDLRVRLGEWDVNHDVEFFPYIERDVISVHIHPEYYAGTLDNDLAILKLDNPVDFSKNPHISPACLPDKFTDFTGARCWTTGWGKDAFGDYGKYQNILKEVDVPILSQQHCQTQLRQTRLGYNYNLNPGFICAGGEEGKDACRGDGGGPLVCERNGIWNVVGVVSWGIGCGQVNVPGVYVRVAHYLDWIRQITQYYN